MNKQNKISNFEKIMRMFLKSDDKVIHITNSREAEVGMINILKENKYTVKMMADFFGIEVRAMYYKLKNLYE